MKIELGKSVVFTLQSGAKKNIIVYGQLSSGLWDIEVDNVRSAYSDLQTAIGEPFIDHK